MFLRWLLVLGYVINLFPRFLSKGKRVYVSLLRRLWEFSHQHSTSSKTILTLLSKTYLVRDFFVFLSLQLTVSNEVADRSVEIIEAALAAGVNFFDTADTYKAGQAETVLGHAFKKLNVDRTDIVVMTKIFFGIPGPDGKKRVNAIGCSRKALVECLEGSLARLQMDYVDVLMCHRCDIHTPIEEVVDTMDMLVNRGKIYYWGTSGWSAEEIRIAINHAKTYGKAAPIAEQPEFSLLKREIVERDYARLFRETGYGTTVYGTLGGGWLSGRYNNATEDHLPEGSRFASKDAAPFRGHYLHGYGSFAQVQRKTKQFAEIAEELGVPSSTLSFMWTLKSKNVSSALVGVTKLEQFRENLEALQHMDKLTPEIVERIDAIFPKPAPIGVNTRGPNGCPL